LYENYAIYGIKYINVMIATVPNE